jgi:uncharacterized protein YkwD
MLYPQRVHARIQPLRHLIWLVLTTILLSACGVASPVAPDSPEALADLRFCVLETNRYRAMVNRAEIEQSSALESYAAVAAEYDGTRHIAHAYANLRNRDGAFARMENEILWWPLINYGSVRAVIRQGIAAMWAEGPAGSHYRALTDPNTTLMGCGVFVGNGEVTVVQAFQ